MKKHFRCRTIRIHSICIVARITAALFYSLICYNEIKAQNISSDDQELSKNIIFLEIGGNSPMLSINYQRFLYDNLGVRVGVGIVIYGLSFPVMLNYYIGDDSNKLELGLGMFHAKYAIYEYEEKTFIGATIGYWHSLSSSGDAIRLSFTPLYDYEKKEICPWGGLSIGWAF